MGALQAASPDASGGEAGHHGLVAGERPQRDYELLGNCEARYGVYLQLEPRVGLQDSVQDGDRGSEAAGSHVRPATPQAEKFANPHGMKGFRNPRVESYL